MLQASFEPYKRWAQKFTIRCQSSSSSLFDKNSKSSPQLSSVRKAKLENILKPTNPIGLGLLPPRANAILILNILPNGFHNQPRVCKKLNSVWHSSRWVIPILILAVIYKSWVQFSSFAAPTPNFPKIQARSFTFSFFLTLHELYIQNDILFEALHFITMEE